MAFRKYGGVNFSATNNIVKNHYNTSDNLNITNQIGQTNSLINFNSDLHLNANLFVTGNTDISGNVDISGNTDISGNVNIYSNLNVKGHSHFIDISGNNLDLSGNLNVNNNVDISGNINVKGHSHFIDISGNNLDLSGNLNVNGNVDISNNLIVKGHSHFIDISGNNIDLLGNLNVNSNVNISNNLIVNGNTTFENNIPVCTLNATQLSQLCNYETVTTLLNNVQSGLYPLAACNCATTANITLSGNQIIDGYDASNCRVLVKNQTNQIYNGIYIVSTGSWSRSSDLQVGSDSFNRITAILNGTLNESSIFIQLNSPGIVGTNLLNFEIFYIIKTNLGQGLEYTSPNANQIQVKSNLNFLTNIDNSGNTLNIGQYSSTQIYSPKLIGTPITPTPVTNDNSYQIASTQYVKNNLNNLLASANTWTGSSNTFNNSIILNNIPAGTLALSIYNASTSSRLAFLNNTGTNYNPSTVSGDNVCLISLNADTSASALNITPWSNTSQGLRLSSTGSGLTFNASLTGTLTISTPNLSYPLPTFTKHSQTGGNYLIYNNYNGGNISFTTNTSAGFQVSALNINSSVITLYENLSFFGTNPGSSRLISNIGYASFMDINNVASLQFQMYKNSTNMLYSNLELLGLQNFYVRDALNNVVNSIGFNSTNMNLTATSVIAITTPSFTISGTTLHTGLATFNGGATLGTSSNLLVGGTATFTGLATFNGGATTTTLTTTGLINNLYINSRLSTGLNNIAIGNISTLQSNNGGTDNIAIGNNALTQSTSSSWNVCIGSNAGNILASSGCVFIGYNSGNTSANSNNFNTCLGYNTICISNPSTGIFPFNSTCIGAYSTVSSAHTIMLGTINEMINIPGHYLSIGKTVATPPSNIAVDISGNLLVSQTSTFTGLATFNGGATTTTLTTTGLATFNGNATTTGLATFNGGATLGTSSNLLVGGTATFTGLATFNGGATTTGLATFNGGATLSGTSSNLLVGGTATFTGLATFNGGATTTTLTTTGLINNLYINSRLSTGSNNIAIGNISTLQSNNGGTDNIAIGINTLTLNTFGYNNCCLGNYNMIKNTIGFNNCSFGMNSLYLNTTGQYNVGIGASTLSNNTTASNNTAIGYSAGNDLSGNSYNNTFLGTNTGISGAYNTSTAIGYNSQITANNQIVLGTITETVSIPGQLNYSIGTITAATTLQVPLKQVYTFNVPSGSPIVYLPVPATKYIGCIVYFKRYPGCVGNIQVQITGSPFLFLPNNSLTLTNILNTSGYYQLFLICNGTYWMLMST